MITFCGPDWPSDAFYKEKQDRSLEDQIGNNQSDHSQPTQGRGSGPRSGSGSSNADRKRSLVIGDWWCCDYIRVPEAFAANQKAGMLLSI